MTIKSLDDAHLKAITARLLQTESHAESLTAARELHALFSSIVKIRSGFQDEDSTQSHLSEGKALSPSDAVRCIFDFMRTRTFLQAVRAAVIEARRRFPEQSIHILYAGCGPFAPLVLPLTTEFTADQIQFTLLDIHERSLDAVRQIVDTLGLPAYVRRYVQCDATSYQHGLDDVPHIIVLEMMQKGLATEPQVAATLNLAPQLRDGGLMIPQEVRLSACLADLSREFSVVELADPVPSTGDTRRKRIDLGEVFKLTAKTSKNMDNWLSPNGSREALRSRPITLRVPPVANGPYSFLLLTNIKVFDSIVLGDYESALTYPTVLTDLGNIQRNSEVEFHYVTGMNPGMRYRLVPGST